MVDYEAIREKILKEEIDKNYNQNSNDNSAEIAALVPMAAGILTGNMGAGAKLGMDYLSSVEKQKKDNSSKLLSYLSSMKINPIKSNTGKIITKDIDVNGVMQTQAFNEDDIRSGNINPLVLGNAQPKGALLVNSKGEFVTPTKAPGQTAAPIKQIIQDQDGSYQVSKPRATNEQPIVTKLKGVGGKPNYRGLQEERLAWDKEKDLENRAAKIKEELEPIQNVEFPLASVEKYLAKNSGKKDLAMLGPLDRLRADYAPFTLNSDDKEFKSQVDSLLRQEAFATGGKTLTTTEKDIATAAYGYLKMGDEENFRRGISKLREFVEMRKASAMASQKPEAAALYKERFKAQGGVEPSSKPTRPISEIRSEKALIEAELQKLKGKQNERR